MARPTLPLVESAVSRAPTEMFVLLVEEHALMRAALRALVSLTPGLSVVAEAHTLSAAPELARLYRPDVVLIDGRALPASDRRGLRDLRHAAPEACVLILSDEPVGRTAEAEGAHGCLAKDADLGVLWATVESILGARCANCALRSTCPVPRLAVALSRRERQVAVRIAQGLTSKQIATALGIRLRTVHTYRESLARKLGASSAAVVTRFVIESGLTTSA